MVEPGNRSGHGMSFVSNFEIEAKLTHDVHNANANTPRTYVLSINCAGADRDLPGRLEIRAVGFSTAAYALQADHIYFLRGRFFADNEADTTQHHLLFNAHTRNLVATSEDFPSSLEDTVAVTGVGIVIEKYIIIEETIQSLVASSKSPASESKPTTVYIVQHSDYSSIASSMKKWRTEYRVRPFLHLLGITKFVQVGSEAVFTGIIMDFNDETNQYIVNADSATLTSGHDTNVKKQPPPGAAVTAAGRVLPLKRHLRPALQSSGSGSSSASSNPAAPFTPLTIEEVGSGSNLPSSSTLPELEASPSVSQSPRQVPKKPRRNLKNNQLPDDLS